MKQQGAGNLQESKGRLDTFNLSYNIAALNIISDRQCLSATCGATLATFMTCIRHLAPLLSVRRLAAAHTCHAQPAVHQEPQGAYAICHAPRLANTY
ncbi:hypothetical protein E2C01_078042 [Portunus trituberculatus]|uniref:Uncharacterized protein n=1 Tax=Portunus trituberculatus TaxID=210409 RepID=A0A5B7IT28_PORTR|nr:hypothetical protein [Portunus trituberculatus]